MKSSKLMLRGENEVKCEFTQNSLPWIPWQMLINLLSTSSSFAFTHTLQLLMTAIYMRYFIHSIIISIASTSQNINFIDMSQSWLIDGVARNDLSCNFINGKVFLEFLKKTQLWHKNIHNFHIKVTRDSQKEIRFWPWSKIVTDSITIDSLRTCPWI